MKRFRQYIKTVVNEVVQGCLGNIKAQIAEEAQTAVEQIRAEIEPAVVRTTEVFLKQHTGHLEKLTKDNLQMYQTTLNVINASHASFQALLKILEPYVNPNLRDEVEREGFKYQVDMALTDLDKKMNEQAHPAILQFTHAKIGKLYQQATQHDMVEIFNAAVQEHSRNWLEGQYSIP